MYVNAFYQYDFLKSQNEKKTKKLQTILKFQGNYMMEHHFSLLSIDYFLGPSLGLSDCFGGVAVTSLFESGLCYRSGNITGTRTSYILHQWDLLGRDQG